MMVPVTIDQAVRHSTTHQSRFVGGEVAEILARLGSPASDVDGRRLEREVHEALARLRTQSREPPRARGASRSPRRR